MGQLFFDIPSYRAKVKMSSLKHLLVEGKSDKRLFTLLLGEMMGPDHKIIVDCAECIKNEDPMGNRHKVEAVCKPLSMTVHADKIVGFVDREFRGFEISDTLIDSLSTHRSANQIVWSRGHSVENYFFCLEVLKIPLRSISNTCFYEEALSLLERSLPSIIRLAAAVSMSALQTNLLSLLGRSVTPELLRSSDSRISIDQEVWLETLQNRHKLDRIKACAALHAFQLWSSRLEGVSNDTCKWACHGHIGLSVILASYISLLELVARKNGSSDPRGEAKAIQRLDDATMMCIFGERWVSLCISDSVDSPIETLKEIGFIPG
jgi:hypothetical protein